jgi:hypothetical protein
MWGTALISMACFLIPKYGAKGLAVSMLLSYALHTLWQMYYVARICAKAGGGLQ